MMNIHPFLDMEFGCIVVGYEAHALHLFYTMNRLAKKTNDHVEYFGTLVSFIYM